MLISKDRAERNNRRSKNRQSFNMDLTDDPTDNQTYLVYPTDPDSQVRNSYQSSQCINAFSLYFS
jgi:hypothetical protein